MFVNQTCLHSNNIGYYVLKMSFFEAMPESLEFYRTKVEMPTLFLTDGLRIFRRVL